MCPRESEGHAKGHFSRDQDAYPSWPHGWRSRFAGRESDSAQCTVCKYFPMDIQELSVEFRDSVIALWEEAGLTRPWNSPEDDFDRASQGDSSVVLGALDNGLLVATAMVGHDGHRGWVYYLAVAESRRRTGLGNQMMSAAEEWVRRNGIVKIQLMVRENNVNARDFYLHAGYEKSDVSVYGRRLD
jgi:ribosomal protein S18 acetylase RimI-like enzyme